MRMPRPLPLAALMFFALEAGCGPDYSVGFHNATSKELNDVGYLDAPNYAHAGVLSPNHSAGFGGWTEPIPEHGTMTWRTDDGVDHRQTVEIRSAVNHPQSFVGDIWFEITDAGIVVRPWSKDRMYAEKKSYPWGNPWGDQRSYAATQGVRADSTKPQERRAESSLCARNISDAVVRDLTLTWREPESPTDRRLAVMAMSPGVSSIATDLGGVPEKVTVAWIGNDRMAHQEEVSLRSNLRDPDHYRGRITICIGPDQKATLQLIPPQR